MTDPLLSDARALAHRLGLIEPGPHGEMVLKESAVRAIQAFGLRQRAEGARELVELADIIEPHTSILEIIARASYLEAQAKEIEG